VAEREPSLAQTHSGGDFHVSARLELLRARDGSRSGGQPRNEPPASPQALISLAIWVAELALTGDSQELVLPRI